MSGSLNRFVSRFRKHDFKRIANASIEVTRTQGYEIPRYECKKCGERLHLDPWQMKALPSAMKYNCDGNKEKKK